MKQTIQLQDFRNAFYKMNRDNHFSYDGLTALFDYYTEYEESTGEDIELDVVAICCTWAEADAATIMQDYSNIIDNVEDVEYVLGQNTTYIKLDDDNFLYVEF